MAGPRTAPGGGRDHRRRGAHPAPRDPSLARARLSLVAATAAAVLSIFAAIACDQTGATGGAPIDGAEAKALVESGAVLVDVRTEREFEAGHLPDALHVPVSQLSDRVDELPRDRTLIVYCQSGVRSARAAAMLGREGFEVRDLGGIGDWPD